MFVLSFVISGKVTSLHKIIKYVKRSKYSFHEFQRKTYAKCYFKNFLDKIVTADHTLSLCTGDDPWTEHAHWFPFCKYVMKIKGVQFIDEVQQRYMSEEVIIHKLTKDEQ